MDITEFLRDGQAQLIEFLQADTALTEYLDNASGDIEVVLSESPYTPELIMDM